MIIPRPLDASVRWSLRQALSYAGRETALVEARGRLTLREIAHLIDYWQPVLAIEDYTAKGSRRCIRVRDLLVRIRRFATTKHLKAVGISRARLRETFAAEGACTKHQVASAIAGRLPSQRKCWMPEDYSHVDLRCGRVCDHDVSRTRRYEL